MTMPPDTGSGADQSAMLVQLLVEQARQGVQLTTLTAIVPDVEQRLRSLERWRYALPVSALIAAGSAAAAIVAALHG